MGSSPRRILGAPETEAAPREPGVEQRDRVFGEGDALRTDPVDARLRGVRRGRVFLDAAVDLYREVDAEQLGLQAVALSPGSPGGVLREAVELTNDARRDIPSTLICTGFTAEQYQTYAKEHPEWAVLAGLPELRNVSWVDLPTSHWPMWSKPADTARIIGDVATKTGGDR